MPISSAAWDGTKPKSPSDDIHWHLLLDTGPFRSRANSPSLNREPGQTFHSRNFIHWTLGWVSFCTHPFEIVTNPKVLRLKLCFGHWDVSDAWVLLKLSSAGSCSWGEMILLHLFGNFSLLQTLRTALMWQRPPCAAPYVLSEEGPKSGRIYCGPWKGAYPTCQPGSFAFCRSTFEQVDADKMLISTFLCFFLMDWCKQILIRIGDCIKK